jgi:hypothetical protein
MFDSLNPIIIAAIPESLESKRLILDSKFDR